MELNLCTLLACLAYRPKTETDETNVQIPEKCDWCLYSGHHDHGEGVPAVSFSLILLAHLESMLPHLCV